MWAVGGVAPDWECGAAYGGPGGDCGGEEVFGGEGWDLVVKGGYGGDWKGGLS